MPTHNCVSPIVNKWSSSDHTIITTCYTFHYSTMLTPSNRHIWKCTGLQIHHIYITMSPQGSVRISPAWGHAIRYLITVFVFFLLASNYLHFEGRQLDFTVTQFPNRVQPSKKHTAQCHSKGPTKVRNACFSYCPKYRQSIIWLSGNPFITSKGLSEQHAAICEVIGKYLG